MIPVVASKAALLTDQYLNHGLNSVLGSNNNRDSNVFICRGPCEDSVSVNMGTGTWLAFVQCNSWRFSWFYLVSYFYEHNKHSWMPHRKQKLWPWRLPSSIHLHLPHFISLPLPLKVTSTLSARLMLSLSCFCSVLWPCPGLLRLLSQKPYAKWLNWQTPILSQSWRMEVQGQRPGRAEFCESPLLADTLLPSHCVHRSCPWFMQ